MKKSILSALIITFLSVITLGSCREQKTTEDKVENAVENAGDAIEDAADDVEDAVD